MSRHVTSRSTRPPAPNACGWRRRSTDCWPWIPAPSTRLRPLFAQWEQRRGLPSRGCAPRSGPGRPDSSSGLPWWPGASSSSVGRHRRSPSAQAAPSPRRCSADRVVPQCRSRPRRRARHRPGRPGSDPHRPRASHRSSPPRPTAEARTASRAASVTMPTRPRRSRTRASSSPRPHRPWPSCHRSARRAHRHPRSCPRHARVRRQPPRPPSHRRPSRRSRRPSPRRRSRRRSRRLSRLPSPRASCRRCLPSPDARDGLGGARVRGLLVACLGRGDGRLRCRQSGHRHTER